MQTAMLDKPKPQLGMQRSTGDSYLVVFSVDVVDATGLGVSRVPVTARFDLGGGYQRSVTHESDADGRARFVEDLIAPARSVVVEAGGEVTGEVVPQPGAKLTLEV